MDARPPDLPPQPNTLLRDLHLECIRDGNDPMTPAMALALQANFASVNGWREDFIGMATAPGNTAAWQLLVFQPQQGSLVNQRAADDNEAATRGVPILALEMNEHTNHIDPGAAAGPYVDAFMGSINWARVYERYQRAVDAASAPFAAGQDDLAGAQVLDVRRLGVYEKADAVIPGATWHDPALVSTWSASLPHDTPVIVYCVYGHEVGRSTAMRLRAAGVNARFLEGGIDGWKTAGRPLLARNA